MQHYPPTSPTACTTDRGSITTFSTGRGSFPTNRAAYATISTNAGLCAQLLDTDKGVDVFVLWKGKPLADATVRLYCESGHEEGSAKTDQRGSVSFTDRQVEDGLNGIMVGHTVKGESGTIGQESYDTVVALPNCDLCGSRRFCTSSHRIAGICVVRNLPNDSSDGYQLWCGGER